MRHLTNEERELATKIQQHVENYASFVYPVFFDIAYDSTSYVCIKPTKERAEKEVEEKSVDVAPDESYYYSVDLIWSTEESEKIWNEMYSEWESLQEDLTKEWIDVFQIIEEPVGG